MQEQPNQKLYQKKLKIEKENSNFEKLKQYEFILFESFKNKAEKVVPTVSIEVICRFLKYVSLKKKKKVYQFVICSKLYDQK